MHSSIFETIKRPGCRGFDASTRYEKTLMYAHSKGRRSLGIPIAQYLLAFGILCTYSSAEITPTKGNLWPKQTESDLRELGQLMRTRYIYGVYEGHPGYPDFDRTLSIAMTRAHIEAASARSPLDYQFVIRHFLASFDDPHISVDFNTSATSFQWPGFLAIYRGHQYRVAGTEVSEVKDGSIIEGCDGGKGDDLVRRVADISRGGAYDESEKTWYAISALTFAENHYQRPPKTCRIDGKDVTLTWRDISANSLLTKQTPYRPYRDEDFSIRPFGSDGAWVRFSFFEPEGAKAKAFSQVIAEAPTLRGKSVVVIDLRGNGGGPYEWFMGFLRSLYGPAFTDYYARERLKIQGVYLDIPEAKSGAGEHNNHSSTPDDEKAPIDPLLQASEEKLSDYAARNGQRVQKSERIAAAFREEPLGSPPTNLVQGIVVVLTDNGSASAVNSFLDEVKHFPNVVQVGTEPMPDRRSGSPLRYPLPSGNGAVLLPYMTRDYRTRVDNQEHVPALHYDGDMRNTAAVQDWILGSEGQLRDIAKHAQTSTR